MTMNEMTKKSLASPLCVCAALDNHRRADRQTDRQHGGNAYCVFCLRASRRIKTLIHLSFTAYMGSHLSKSSRIWIHIRITSKIYWIFFLWIFYEDSISILHKVADRQPNRQTDKQTPPKTSATWYGWPQVSCCYWHLREGKGSSVFLWLWSYKYACESDTNYTFDNLIDKAVDLCRRWFWLSVRASVCDGRRGKGIMSLSRRFSRSS